MRCLLQEIQSLSIQTNKYRFLVELLFSYCEISQLLEIHPCVRCSNGFCCIKSFYTKNDFKHEPVYLFFVIIAT